MSDLCKNTETTFLIDDKYNIIIEDIFHQTYPLNQSPSSTTSSSTQPQCLLNFTEIDIKYNDKLPFEGAKNIIGNIIDKLKTDFKHENIELNFNYDSIGDQLFTLSITNTIPVEHRNPTTSATTPATATTSATTPATATTSATTPATATTTTTTTTPATATTPSTAITTPATATTPSTAITTPATATTTSQESIIPLNNYGTFTNTFSKSVNIVIYYNLDNPDIRTQVINIIDSIKNTETFKKIITTDSKHFEYSFFDYFETHHIIKSIFILLLIVFIIYVLYNLNKSLTN